MTLEAARHVGSSSPESTSPASIVSAITEDGYLRVQRLPQNGLTPMFNELYSAQPVKVGTSTGAWIDGVVAGLSVHLAPGRANPPKPSDLDEMYVDIGASSADEVRKAGVDVLSPIALNRRLFDLAGSEFAGAAIGDRFGAAALLELLASIDPARIKGTLTIAFVIAAAHWRTRLAAHSHCKSTGRNRSMSGASLPVARSQVLIACAALREKIPGGGVLLVGAEETNAPLHRVSRRTQSASLTLTKFRSPPEYSANVIPTGYLPAPPLPPNFAHIGIATAWADTPAETINSGGLRCSRGSSQGVFASLAASLRSTWKQASLLRLETRH